MPIYLWSGKTKSGAEMTERVTAATMDEGKSILLAQGWTDLRLETDGTIQDFVKGQIDEVSAPEYRPVLTPKEELAYHQGKGVGFWAEWWKALLGTCKDYEVAVSHLILAALLAWSIYRHNRWGIIICGGLLAALILLFPVLRFWFGKPSRLFAKLHHARNWRRWNEVLEYLEEFDRLQRSRKIGIGKAAMAQYRALALAGLGKLDQAVKLFSEAAQTSGMPGGVYYSLLSSVYSVAGEHDQALNCRRCALEEATDKGTFYLDLAAYLVSHFNQPAEARKYFALAESSQLPEQIKAHLPGVRSMIEYREGDFAAAQKDALEALGSLEKLAKGRYYVFEPLILMGQGYLAVINANLGNKEQACDYFAKSGKYMETVRMDELLAQYHKLMG